MEVKCSHKQREHISIYSTTESTQVQQSQFFLPVRHFYFTLVEHYLVNHHTWKFAGVTSVLSCGNITEHAMVCFSPVFFHPCPLSKLSILAYVGIHCRDVGVFTFPFMVYSVANFFFHHSWFHSHHCSLPEIFFFVKMTWFALHVNSPLLSILFPLSSWCHFSDALHFFIVASSQILLFTFFPPFLLFFFLLKCLLFI